MATAISAAVWALGKALAPVTDDLLKNWAASDSLGPNISALKTELLRAQGILYTAQDRVIANPALKKLLHMLRQLADKAEDVLDELDYFRIQDELDNTYHAADKHAGGCMCGLALNARHTARAVASKLNFSSAGILRTPKLKFDRVKMSKRMADIVHQLDPICVKVKEILDLELRKVQPTQGIRPKTTPTIIEPKIFGRNVEKKNIVDGITHGKYCADGLTVLQIVGPGGIGKTTFTQHIYQEVKSSFDVMIWICVSLNFDANRLAQEILRQTPKVNGEKENAIEEELIKERLKHKRFLLVLDDVWTYEEDEWKKLLAPFRKGEARGNMVIVTTRIPETETVGKIVDYSIELNGLGTEDFMHLFEAYVFGHQQPWKDHPELLDVGKEIVGKLKGFPLAAKTVGRLLSSQLTLDNWTRVLESKEWELQTSDHDIMPALKLSYDYLPFHLQQCFFYGALFPEDYEYGSNELVHLWTGLDILDSSDQRKRLEDVGLCYLNDLVNRGFFKKNVKVDGSARYIMHDLLHELAVKVSSSECLSISSSNVRYVQSSPSVRHLSIIIDERDVNDRMAFEDFKRDLSTLEEKLKVEDLQTVMLFGKHHGCFAKTFGDLFAEAKALRVILLSETLYGYIVEDVFCNFPRLVHLRYLRIIPRAKITLTSNMSRFYHLRVLDVQEHNVHDDFPRDVSKLTKLNHYLVQKSGFEHRTSDVGKLELLQDLRSFMVKKENIGFEMRQIGRLAEFGVSLRIHSIENAERQEEVNEAKLIHKTHIQKLMLEWGIGRPNKDPAKEDHVLESLQPHSNLLELHIGGHGGATCPSWLGSNLSVKALESLCLVDVAWNNFPPIGELFVSELGEEHPSGIPSQSFQNLKELKLVKVSRLKKWVGISTCHFVSLLEVLIIEDCSELVELPFSGSESVQEAYVTWFPRLQKLEIMDCPKLLALPPVPWTSAPCSAKIERVGSGFEELAYSKNCRSESSLKFVGKEGGHDSTFWNILAFSNLADLLELKMRNCPPLPLDQLQKLTSMRCLKIADSNNLLSPTDVESAAIYQLRIGTLQIWNCSASEKELAQLLSYLPYLSKLEIYMCAMITRVGVVEQQKTTHKMGFGQTGLQPQETREEEEIATVAAGGEAGIVLLPPQLQELFIHGGQGGGGLQGLRNLRKLFISGCPKFLSYSFSRFPFPTSLQTLSLNDIEGQGALLFLSDLTSLRNLEIYNCGDLRGEGIWALAQCSLTVLRIGKSPKFFASSEPQNFPHSCKIEEISTDDHTGFLVAPICSLLSSSLTKLCLYRDENDEVERFSKEQEDALQLLSSLQELSFRSFRKLQCLPAGLHRISSLKTLQIANCQAFRSLPKDGLPSSLQSLRIWYCPALKSLPEDSLPSSLRKIDFLLGNSEELMWQCRRLKGTIPIIEG
ncbi:disease resistance protein RGA2-like [Lolium rigidum]|uniref:disease resistance protein RGA2-like n=1 Tax=Lolium rigidum TaxID=89674 RepID=UPI001F5C6FBF|nr:disease resistance protein RGA2-like [Lolium rigidum]